MIWCTLPMHLVQHSTCIQRSSSYVPCLLTPSPWLEMLRLFLKGYCLSSHSWWVTHCQTYIMSYSLHSCLCTCSHYPSYPASLQISMGVHFVLVCLWVITLAMQPVHIWISLFLLATCCLHGYLHMSFLIWYCFLLDCGLYLIKNLSKLLYRWVC